MSLFAECAPGATLGTGEDLRVFLTTRGATRLLAELAVTGGDFARKLDGTGDCSVTGQFAGSDPDCCRGWSDVVPWATELMVVRDGRDAWAGPVVDVNFASGTVTVLASDLSAWWDRRTVPDLAFTDAYAVDVFRAIHEAAMAPDPVPNFDLFVQTIAGQTLTRTYLASERQYASDALAEVSKTAVDWTAYGRTIVLSSEELDVPPYATILDDWWDEPPQVQVAGNEQATQVVMKGKGDLISIATADQAMIDTYGLLVRVFTESNIEDQASLDFAARTRLDYMVQPLFITPPQGATLRSTAPITVPELVPGIRVRVDTSSTCKRVVGDFRLDGVKVGFDGKVSIDLSPIGYYAGAPDTDATITDDSEAA